MAEALPRRYYPQLHDREWLQAQVNAGRNSADIAAIVGCSAPGANDALVRNGVMVQRTCKVCGETFDYQGYKAHIRQCKRPLNQAIRTATCPHCGEMFQPATVAEHAERCYHNPVAYAMTRQLLDDGDGVIMQRDQYIARRVGTRAMSHHLLQRLFGSWPQVAAAFGLLSSADAAEARAADEVAEEREIAELERKILEAEQHRGLPACGMRALPTGGVAYMLR